MAKKLCLFLLLIVGSFTLPAQSNHLDKKVSFSADNWPLHKVFTQMELTADFYFSFDSELINSDTAVSITVENTTVSEVLKRILPSSLEFKSVGNHVVIFTPLPKKPEEIILKGYIIDGRSKQKLAYATLYAPQQNVMVASNAEGYYEMILPINDQKMGLTLNKKGYRQEVIYINENSNNELDLSILKLEEPLVLNSKNAIDQPFDDRPIVKLWVPDKVIESSDNLTVFDKIPFQFSLVPGISTAGLLNSSSVNSVSFNLLAGYSKGTQGVEIGGLFNLNKTSVEGVQIAGLVNMAGGKIKGAQVAGLVNYVGDSVTGVQVAGLHNSSTGYFEGAQIAGITNFHEGDFLGAQIAGIGNFSNNSVYGGQISGIINRVKDTVEAQISGIINMADYSTNAQISGIANICFTQNNGAQISSYNRAKNNNGYQIGFINRADSSTGVPIGFISFVKYGYHVLEVSANDLLIPTVGFKTGVKRFYNIIELGANANYLQASYGVGTIVPLANRFDLSLDVIGSAVLEIDEFNEVDFDNPSENQFGYSLFRFKPSICFQWTPKFGLALGPVLNYAVGNAQNQTEPVKLSHQHFYEYNGQFYHQAWLGLNLSLRFF